MAKLQKQGFKIMLSEFIKSSCHEFSRGPLQASNTNGYQCTWEKNTLCYLHRKLTEPTPPPPPSRHRRISEPLYYFVLHFSLAALTCWPPHFPSGHLNSHENKLMEVNSIDPIYGKIVATWT